MKLNYLITLYQSFAYLIMVAVACTTIHLHAMVDSAYLYQLEDGKKLILFSQSRDKTQSPEAQQLQKQLFSSIVASFSQQQHSYISQQQHSHNCILLDVSSYARDELVRMRAHEQPTYGLLPTYHDQLAARLSVGITQINSAALTSWNRRPKDYSLTMDVVNQLIFAPLEYFNEQLNCRHDLSLCAKHFDDSELRARYFSKETRTRSGGHSHRESIVRSLVELALLGYDISKMRQEYNINLDLKPAERINSDDIDAMLQEYTEKYNLLVQQNVQGLQMLRAHLEYLRVRLRAWLDNHPLPQYQMMNQILISLYNHTASLMNFTKLVYLPLKEWGTVCSVIDATVLIIGSLNTYQKAMMFAPPEVIAGVAEILPANDLNLIDQVDFSSLTPQQIYARLLQWIE